jgi:hypothetical protein
MTIQQCGCRASLFIVDGDEESEQDGHISAQCGGCALDAKTGLPAGLPAGKQG